MAGIWTELKRRNVIRVGIAYVLVCWVLLQIADFALQVIDAPVWILQVLVLIAAISLPAVLVFAWVYEMTPEGLKLESELDRSQSVTAYTGRRLNAVIVFVLVIAVGFFGASRFLTTHEKTADNNPAVDEALPRSIAVMRTGQPSRADSPGSGSSLQRGPTQKFPVAVSNLYDLLLAKGRQSLNRWESKPSNRPRAHSGPN